jgi:hypothetical protein
MVEVSRHKSVDTLRPRERREAARAIGHSEYAEGDTLMDETSLSQALPRSLKKALQNSLPSGEVIHVRLKGAFNSPLTKSLPHEVA